MDHYQLRPIGFITTPFKQKLGVPRQPGLAPSARGTIKLTPEFAREDALRGLESFDKLWLIFWCHLSQSWRQTVKPPRLGGDEKVGVFATRSPHRPNPVAMSVVTLEGITQDFQLVVSGVDLVDQTPILDIKPYLHLWDSHPQASLGWIERQPLMPEYEVIWRQKSAKEMLGSELTHLLQETLRWNPRPSYVKHDQRSYTHQLGNYDITWSFDGSRVVVEHVTWSNSPSPLPAT